MAGATQPMTPSSSWGQSGLALGSACSWIKSEQLEWKLDILVLDVFELERSVWHGEQRLTDYLCKSPDVALSPEKD